MSKPLVVVVLLVAALASAALVFFAMSALSEDEPPATVASEPTTSAEAPEPEPEPTEADLVLRTDITDANLFVDAFDRGPIEPESRRTLALGAHRIEARRGATVIAALTVELAAGGAEVELHADGTTAQTATPDQRPQPTRVAVREARAPAPASSPPAPASSPAEPASPTPAPTPATPTPATPATAPAVAAAPAAPAPAPIAPRVATASSIEVVDQAAATTVVPAPNAPPPAPMAPIAAPVMVTPTPTRAAGPPSEAEMRRALDSVIVGVRGCAEGFHGELDVSATFQPDGSVRARIGRLPTREARYCVQRVIQSGVRSSPFEGRAVGFRHEYRL